MQSLRQDGQGILPSGCWILYSRSALVNGQQCSRKAWDRSASFLFQLSEAEANLAPIWLAFSASSTMGWSRGEEGISPNYQWTLQTSLLQGQSRMC